MKTFTLERIGQTTSSTWGEFRDGETQICKILERGPPSFGVEEDPHPRVPCGTYVVERRPLGESKFDESLSQFFGGTYKGVLRLVDVPGRSNIEIHPANNVDELLGCLAPGMTLQRDARKNFAVGRSRVALALLYEVVSAAIDDGGASIMITESLPMVEG